MKNKEHHLIISVDLDEWYHARWATGSKTSRWPDTSSFFNEVYGLYKPRGDIEKPTMEILELLNEFNISATFFILGEVGRFYPQLIKEISQNGHEIASHGNRHVDLWTQSRKSFRSELNDAKNLLEDLVGKKLVGYRAPNLIIEDWIVPVLSELGFEYDSSVCPSRKLMGKFSNTKSLPAYPYFLSKDSFEPGTGPLFEIPIPVFPYIKLPAATGIMTRVIGAWWTIIALKNALNQNDAIYYFHPYELTRMPKISALKFIEKIHSRRSGKWMTKAIKKIFVEFKDIPKLTCKQLMDLYKKN